MVHGTEVLQPVWRGRGRAGTDALGLSVGGCRGLNRSGSSREGRARAPHGRRSDGKAGLGLSDAPG